MSRPRSTRSSKSTPILFGKGEIVISPQSTATVERIAGIVKRFGGTSIEVQGHTDSEGDPGRNLTLSEQRAKAVRRRAGAARRARRRGHVEGIW